MAYRDMIDEDLRLMDEQGRESSRLLRPNEIQVPLRSLMDSPVTIEIEASVQAAIDQMLDNKVGAVLIVSDGILKGIFGERDVLYRILNTALGDLTEIPVEHFMKAEPQTSHVDDSLDSAIFHMARGGYRHIPIVDDQNRPVGMVSIRHIISYLVEHFPQEILTLPPEPLRNSIDKREGA
jgi:CBS domain-containing protein